MPRTVTSSMPRTILLLLLLIPATSLAAPPNAPMEIDPLEVRPSLATPRLSLPTNLTTVPVNNPGEYFVPPYVEDIPDDKFGDMVKLGRNVFVNTQVYGKRYAGNGLNCSNCHLSEGRKANAAPLWGAYPRYPMYRNKNGEVVTFPERVQDCFVYSLDGIAPTVDAPEVEAITAYAHWLSTGAPVGVVMPGRGFAPMERTRTPSTKNGRILYETQCALCHGENGKGYKHEDGRPGYMFPPLWGWDSFNRAAGMNKVRTAAKFIKANMPLGKGFTLTDNEAADLAFYMWIQFRPYDPRRAILINVFMPPPGANK
uniref:Thiosulfate dehydrogenase n=2 Tax=Candidatus Kentrum sp. MB TaxID=2138164 RepID=A0A450XJC5_9GAMM|nr:MAG: thiosulfate dehydrogenase [Candidatus Kentron sp. MB]VFK74772.1 MAG: thiosulfate dehydrogenase [Candidatus Kentron sp. MB]